MCCKMCYNKLIFQPEIPEILFLNILKGEGFVSFWIWLSLSWNLKFWYKKNKALPSALTDLYMRKTFLISD